MKKYLIIILTAFLASCGAKNDKGEEVAPPPGKAILIAPALNELCTQGTVTSPTESTVNLQWKAAENAEGYELIIKNLEAGTTTSTKTTSTQISVSLKRNTAYSWYIKSGSSTSSVTSQSDIWKFYNAGPATVNYAPFPADLISPTLGQLVTAVNGKVSVTWVGNDVDNDIESYDIYFGDTPAPTIVSTGITATSLNELSVQSGKQYYWKVITKDRNGNKSESGVQYFKVN